MAIKLKSVLATTLIVGSTLFGATPSYAQNPSGKALTWQGYPLPVPSKPNIVRVGCGWNSTTSQNACNPYNGDTNLKKKRRILCFVPGNSTVPPEYEDYASAARPTNWQFYMGWSGGEVGLTNPVRGTEITSKAYADKMCKAQLQNETAVMAEHHDAGGGWSYGAHIHQNSVDKHLLRGKQQKKRFWTSINDQNANPW